MRHSSVWVLMILAVVAPASAQDSAPPDPRRAQQLREAIEQRFGERLKEELGLTEDQAGKVRVAMATIAAKRRILQEEEQRLRMALAVQLRPGVAANSDSVAKLVDALTNQRVAFAQSFREEMRELSAILTPVQRGQYMILRDRLMARAEELRQRMGPPQQRGQVLPPGRRRPPG